MSDTMSGTYVDLSVQEWDEHFAVVTVSGRLGPLVIGLETPQSTRKLQEDLNSAEIIESNPKNFKHTTAQSNARWLARLMGGSEDEMSFVGKKNGDVAFTLRCKGALGWVAADGLIPSGEVEEFRTQFISQMFQLKPNFI